MYGQRAISLLFLCFSVVWAGNYVQYFDGYSDNGYAWYNVMKDIDKPSTETLKSWAWSAYGEMYEESRDIGACPGAMSVAWWESKDNPNKGTVVFHSSVKNSPQHSTDASRDYVDECNIGGHSYYGHCGEISNIAFVLHWSRSTISTNRKAYWSVYGVTRRDASGEAEEYGYMEPCDDVEGRRGCKTYIDRIKRQGGGGGVVKREFEQLDARSPGKKTRTADAKTTATHTKTKATNTKSKATDTKAAATNTKTKATNTKATATNTRTTDLPTTLATSTKAGKSASDCHCQTNYPTIDDKKKPLPPTTIPSSLLTVLPTQAGTKTGAAPKSTETGTKTGKSTKTRTKTGTEHKSTKTSTKEE